MRRQPDTTARTDTFIWFPPYVSISGGSRGQQRAALRLALVAFLTAAATGTTTAVVAAIGNAAAISQAERNVHDSNAILDELTKLPAGTLASLAGATRRGRWEVRITKSNGSVFEIVVAAPGALATSVAATIERF